MCLRRSQEERKGLPHTLQQVWLLVEGRPKDTVVAAPPPSSAANRTPPGRGRSGCSSEGGHS